MKINFPSLKTNSLLESAMLNKKVKLENGLKQFWAPSSHPAKPMNLHSRTELFSAN